MQIGRGLLNENDVCLPNVCCAKLRLSDEVHHPRLPPVAYVGGKHKKDVQPHCRKVFIWPEVSRLEFRNLGAQIRPHLTTFIPR